jgi:hypothetical protein
MVEFSSFLSVNFPESSPIDDRVLQNFLMENLFNRFRDASCKTNLLIVNDLNQDIYNVPANMNVFKLKVDDNNPLTDPITVKKNPNKYYSGSVKKDLMKLVNDYANDGKFSNPSSELFIYKTTSLKFPFAVAKKGIKTIGMSEVCNTV